jgi:hypothetical protein
MSDRDELFQLILGRTTTKAVERILAAGYRKPRTVTTVEELDALPVDSVVMESEHDTFIIRTMRGVFHRFPDGWYVVAGHGAREDIYIQLPATVLTEPQP